MKQVDIRYRLRRDIPWVIAVVSLQEAISATVMSRYGYDSHAYWVAWRHGLYGAAPNTPDAYLYSPAFAELIWPIAQLPWPAFATIYSLILLALLTWLLKPLPLRLSIPFGIAGLNEVMVGNVFLVFALVVVLGFRYPAGWAFVALTKVTPCLGPVWFLVRREWRDFAVSVIATLLVVFVSWCTVPHLWADWVRFLIAHRGETDSSLGAVVAPPLVARLPLALILVVWGALKDKRWTVPVAMVLSMPVFWVGALATLFALPRIRKSVRQGGGGVTGIQ